MELGGMLDDWWQFGRFAVCGAQVRGFEPYFYQVGISNEVALESVTIAYRLYRTVASLDRKGYRLVAQSGNIPDHNRMLQTLQSIK